MSRPKSSDVSFFGLEECILYEEFWNTLLFLFRSYQYYVLAIVSLGYTLAELGHYLIGVTSRETARDVHYGDLACVLNVSLELFNQDVSEECEIAPDIDSCLQLELNGTKYCEWDFNGQGMEYQVMAGPGFTVPLSVVGVLMGILGDRYNRYVKG